MNKTGLGIALLGAAAAAGAVFFFNMTPRPPGQAQAAGGAPDGPGAPIVRVVVPGRLSEQAMIGKRAYDGVCAACHGENGAGREGMGPPFVHAIYRPGHHADMAIQRAVQFGVKAHHWRFGDMPPQQGLTNADVMAITRYVRELQQANGID